MKNRASNSACSLSLDNSMVQMFTAKEQGLIELCPQGNGSSKWETSSCHNTIMLTIRKHLTTLMPNQVLRTLSMLPVRLEFQNS